MDNELLSYTFGLEFTRLMALNDDKTIPTPDRMVGGAGPFDFSQAVNTTSVSLITKVDGGTNGLAETNIIDMNAATIGDIKAVTVAELVAIINNADPEGLVASQDTATGRIKLACKTSHADAKYVQVYGELAKIAKFGQGWGLKFIKSEVLKSIDIDPTIKESETIVTTAANGRESSIVTRSYKRGFTGALVDSADNFEMRAFVEGGTLVLDGTPYGGTYEDPTEDSKKPTFIIQAFYAAYREGLNNEEEHVGVYLEEFRSCVGSFGSESHGRAYKDGNYAIIGTNYRDENGKIWAAKHGTMLSREKYEQLDVLNV